FFADASHELVTPLTIARGHLEIATRKHQSRRELDGTVRLVLDELDRMQALTAALLQLARFDGSYFPNRQATPASDLAATIAARWGGTPVRLWGFERGADGVVKIDRPALERAIDSVIENAFRHTQPGDAITVSFDVVQEHLVVVVRDTGEGIPEEALP